ncbi:MAG: ribosome assembly factor SBDS [Methanobacteriota archaeon]
MVSLEHAVVARLETHGSHFEVLVDPELALRFRSSQGKDEVDWDETLASDMVFKDARKGDKAADENLVKVFGTKETVEVAKRIVLKGDIQLTTDQRRKMVEAKRKQIVTYIARNAINPQTNAPHPPQRIEIAMDEAKVHVDPFKGNDEQIKEVLAAIRPLIPIKIQSVSIAVHLPATEVGKAYGFVRAFATLKKEEWQKDGSWVGVVEMPAGLQTDFFNELNQRTHGNVETKLVK